MKKTAIAVYLSLQYVAALAACPSIPTASRFVTNGAEVTDKKNGLVWARCSAGQSWDGRTCTGIASTFNHEAAFAYAKAQSGWRLPNIKELFSLADRGCTYPAIDNLAFPAMPKGYYWTSTPNVGWRGTAYRIDFDSGDISFKSRDEGSIFVRLVRTSGSAPGGTVSGASAAAIQSASSVVTSSAGQNVPGSVARVGESVTFSVTAAGSAPISYQWYRNGVAIAGATSASYTIAKVAGTDDKSAFTVRVSNAANTAGSVSSPTQLKILPATGIELVAGTIGSTGSLDGAGSAAKFNSPSGITIDSGGNLYVADSSNHTIRKISPAGNVTTIAGSAGQSGNSDGIGAAARFNGPSDIKLGLDGNLYVVDKWNNRIRSVSPSGIVSSFVGGGVSGADGLGAVAGFSRPNGIAIDAHGNMFVSDGSNHTIRKITPAGIMNSSGQVTTVAGSPGVCGTSDGLGSAARFCYPAGIAVDAGGNIYVADQWNNTIRKITAAGQVSTIAGVAGRSGTTDGSATTALFNFPSSLTIDPEGNLFIVQSNRVRKLSVDGMVSTVAGGPGVGVILGSLPGGLDYPGGMTFGPRYSGRVMYTTNRDSVVSISLP